MLRKVFTCKVIILLLTIGSTVWAGQIYEAADDEQESNNSSNGRIVGGSNTDIRQYPHQISMQYKGRHRCGGSLISTNVVVSAAHCVVGTDKKALTIVAGTTLLSEKHLELPVIKYIVHEDYNKSPSDYDVAILILQGLFPINTYIRPIALAEERLPGETVVTVTGWGVLQEGGSMPDQLQHVNLKIVENSSCKYSYPFMLTSRMMCANVDGGGKDACQGDSGGPLIANNRLLGIVSFGFGCARKSFPGVYASVPELHEWIAKTAKANEFSYA